MASTDADTLIHPPWFRTHPELMASITAVERNGSPESPQSGSSSDQKDQKEPSRKRASRPKVRTGCVSCKKRHLKCDERKPACLRCENFGSFCEGYVPPKTTKKKPAPRVERILLPRPGPGQRLKTLHVKDSLACGAVSAAGVQAALPMQPSVMGAVALDGDDAWYFSLFRHHVTNEMSPYYHSDFWSRMSLRETLTNEAIRHSVLSIGAYCRAILSARELEMAEPLSIIPWQHQNQNHQHHSWTNTRRGRHQRAALTHHAKALACIRMEIEAGGISTRLTMMATLLFVLFENMQGNYHASGNLVKTGVKMLCGEISTCSRMMDDPEVGASPASAAARQRCRYYQAMSPGETAVTPPPTIRTLAVDSETAEMTQMFARHSVACLFVHFQHCKFAYHLLLDSRLSSPEQNPALPLRATTPAAARAMWDYYLPHLGRLIQKCVWHNLHPSYEFDAAAVVQEQDEHLAWLRAFGNSLEELSMSATVRGRREQRGIALLKANHIVATIFTTCCSDVTESLYDGFADQFASTVGLCRALTRATTATRPAAAAC